MLELHDTMHRGKRPFQPIVPGRASIFTCGPSIYRRPHIGNYRTFMYEDILLRYLRFSGYEVNRSIPLTDIEDKTIAEAMKRKMKIEELTEDIAGIFFRECGELGILLPEPVPRSSWHVDEAADIVLGLMKKGHAYSHGKDIYFDPLTFRGFGKLFRLDMSRWPAKKTRFHRDTYPGTRWNRGDFILWHGYRDGDPSSWETSVGRGRPSWNVQDPAVALATVGLKVDINCGGIDNIYRHHDYNIAIIESLTGEEYARYYLHGAHLIVEGATMSKSRGNILYPEDVYARGFSPFHLRFMLWHRHYRSKLNFNWKKMKTAAKRLDTLRDHVSRLTAAADGRKAGGRDSAREILDEFRGAMDDDLSAGRAFELLESRLPRLTPADAPGAAEALAKIDSVLGVLF